VLIYHQSTGITTPKLKEAIQMDEKEIRVSDEVLIEIIHGIKEIIVELINHAFPQTKA
jgi:hypothetical protein